MISIHMTTACRYQNGLLQRAIESVLTQSYSDFEFIICDDASTDGTADYLDQIAKKDARVRIIRNNTNVNSVAVSLGRCFQNTSTDRKYITWMFDDNILLPDALLKLITAANNDTQLDFVFGNTVCHRPNGDSFIVGKDSETFIRQNIATNSSIVPNAGMLICKDFFEKVGWYDASIVLRRSTDWDLFRRMIENGNFKIIPDTLAEEYGELEADSLRNTYKTSLPIMIKYCQLRDLAKWPVTLEAALNHPIDRIPPKTSEIIWSSAELKTIYLMFLEYYLSIGDMLHAPAWAQYFSKELPAKFWWLPRLLENKNPADPLDRRISSGAYAGIIFGLISEGEKNIQAQKQLQMELQKLRIQNRTLEAKLNTPLLKVTAKINNKLKKLPLIHKILKLVFSYLIYCAKKLQVFCAAKSDMFRT